MKKKRNWVKGFDRIAILLAIPIAIFGFSFTVKKYSEKKAVRVFAAQHHFDRLFDIIELTESLGLSESNKIIAHGRKALMKISEDLNIKFRLGKAYAKGGDPHGSLVIDSDDFIILIPRRSKRYAAGVGGALGFALITILSIALPVRIISKTIKWIGKGFNEN